MRTIRILAILLILLAVAGVQPGHAQSRLLLSDGNDVLTIDDGSPLDSHPLEGVVTYIGPVGVFNLNVTTGLGYPAVGDLNEPQVDLNDISVSGAGTLFLAFSQTGFGGLAGMRDFTSAVGGVTDGNVSFGSFFDNNNNLLNSSGLLAYLGPFSNGAFSGSSTTSVFTSSLFSLTSFAVIEHSGAQQVSSFDFMLTGTPVAPEPVSSALFLVGAGAMAWRRRARA